MHNSFISNFKDNRKDIKVFFLTVAAIFVVIVLILEGYFYWTGETLPYDQVIQRQARTGEYYAPKYFNVYRQYKMLGIKRLKPEVLVLGTSRMMRFEKKHFPGKRFYNGAVDAVTAWGSEGVLDILHSLKDDELPHKIILGIDPWIFNPNYAQNREFKMYQLKKKFRDVAIIKGGYLFLKSLKEHIMAYDLVINETKKPLEFLPEVFKKKGIGLNAVIFHTGFSIDGNFVFPVTRERNDFTDIPQTMDAWQKKLAHENSFFPPAHDVDQNAVKSFEELLDYCKSRNVDVIVMVAPFRPDYYDALTTLDTHKEFFQKFREVLPKLVTARGYLFFDYASPYSLKLGNDDFDDNMHAYTKFNDIVSLQIGKAGWLN
ncbi:MAG: hypothetical protein HQL25_02645 [Candidatus Omnitrophica bacterium]|nr:hypothetical protein [Candidatus Omnitrophota bacterium]